MPIQARTTVKNSRLSSVELKSFPEETLQLPPKHHVFTPNTLPGQPIPRELALQQCIQDLNQALSQAIAVKQGIANRLLFVLPDKTRTQVAAQTLIDAGLQLKQQNPNLDITLLYGLGTHPFMTAEEIERLIGPDRYLQVEAAGFEIYQQSTKAITTELSRVTIWDFAQTVPAIVKTKSDVARIPPLLQHSGLTDTMPAAPRLFIHIAPTLLDTHLDLVAALLIQLDKHMGQRRWKLSLDRRCVTSDHLEQLRQTLAPESRCTLRCESAAAQTVDLSLALMPQTDACFGVRWGRHYTIQVPKLLFQNHLTVVAGDTKIHPYEGRYGSGGINKMLAVGIASLDEIRRSHSTQVLLHDHTRVGDGASPFVAQLERTASSIRYAMLTRRDSLALVEPYGFSAIAQGSNQIWATAFGQSEASRHQIATDWKHAFTVNTPEPFDLVIHDVAPHKGTDILAGARTLQYLCDWHSASQPLLTTPETDCVAVMFNRCSEPKNNSGIGNEGTKAHMDVLGQIVATELDPVAKRLSQATTLSDAKHILNTARDRILQRWQQHLIIISQSDQLLSELYDLTCQGERLQQRGVADPIVLPLLLEKLERDCQGFTPLAKTLNQIYQTLYQQRQFSSVKQAVHQALNLYSQHEGLGEGGQRTLRLLKICRCFGTWLVATDNPAVIHYLQTLDPDLSQHLPIHLRPSLDKTPLPVGILGIVPVDLAHRAPQYAVEVAIAYGHWHKPKTQLNTGFLTAPLILQRSGLQPEVWAK
ncbi:MAG: hypothetical protein AAFW84_07500 [Cyanobacteria bacterium J06635_15]